MRIRIVVCGAEEVVVGICADAEIGIESRVVSDTRTLIGFPQGSPGGTTDFLKPGLGFAG